MRANGLGHFFEVLGVGPRVHPVGLRRPHLPSEGGAGQPQPRARSFLLQGCGGPRGGAHSSPRQRNEPRAGALRGRKVLCLITASPLNTGPFLLFGNSVLEPEDPRVPSHLNRGALRTPSRTFFSDPLNRDWREGEDSLPRLLNRKTITVLIACA